MPISNKFISAYDAALAGLHEDIRGDQCLHGSAIFKNLNRKYSSGEKIKETNGYQCHAYGWVIDKCDVAMNDNAKQIGRKKNKFPHGSGSPLVKRIDCGNCFDKNANTEVNAFAANMNIVWTGENLENFMLAFAAEVAINDRRGFACHSDRLLGSSGEFGPDGLPVVGPQVLSGNLLIGSFFQSNAVFRAWASVCVGVLPLAQLRVTLGPYTVAKLSDSQGSWAGKIFVKVHSPHSIAIATLCQ